MASGDHRNSSCVMYPEGDDVASTVWGKGMRERGIWDEAKMVCQSAVVTLRSLIGVRVWGATGVMTACSSQQERKVGVEAVLMTRGVTHPRHSPR